MSPEQHPNIPETSQSAEIDINSPEHPNYWSEEASLARGEVAATNFEHTAVEESDMPAVTTVPYSAESAAAIAQHKIIQSAAQLQQMTPPAPGTPVETYVPPTPPQNQ